MYFTALALILFHIDVELLYFLSFIYFVLKTLYILNLMLFVILI